MFAAAEVELPGIPEASSLRRSSAGSETVVSFGNRLVFHYADGDIALRNLAIAALREAGVSGLEVATVFGLSPEQVSRLRTRVQRDGSAGLALPRGRRPKLSNRQVATVRRLAGQGVKQTEIAKRFEVWAISETRDRRSLKFAVD